MPNDNELSLLDAGGALEALSRAEVDLQIATAHRYPRDIKRFRENVIAQIDSDPDFASLMFYVLPARKGGDGQPISGPSIRLAELAASEWGNLRMQARIVEIGDRFLTAQGICHDLESNVACSIEIKRRITNKHGQRYGDDMIQTTCGAAASIGIRQSVIKVIPRAWIKLFEERAKQVCVGEQKELASRRKKMIEWFAAMHVDSGQICAYLKVKSISDIKADELAVLKGVATALQDKEADIEDYFPSLRKSEIEDKPKSAAEDGQVTAEDLLGGEVEEEGAKKEKSAEKPSEAQKPGNGGRLFDDTSEEKAEPEKDPVQHDAAAEKGNGDRSIQDSVLANIDRDKLPQYVRDPIDKLLKYKQPARIRTLLMEVEEVGEKDFFPEQLQLIRDVADERLQFLARQMVD